MYARISARGGGEDYEKRRFSVRGLCCFFVPGGVIQKASESGPNRALQVLITNNYEC